jgi:cobalt-zinc-cadmium efflux system protein
VLIGSVVMMFVYIPVLDSLLSLGIAGLILFNVFRNMKYAFRIILQGIPDNTSEASIRDAALKVEGVKGVHDIHGWSMDGEYNIFTLHVVVANQTTTEQMEVIKNEVRHRMQHLNAQHITIEMELEDQPCALQDC